LLLITELILFFDYSLVYMNNSDLSFALSAYSLLW
jgi:hypothetical protein